MNPEKLHGPIRVLLVEDRPEDAELLLREMRRGGLDVNNRRVENEGASCRPRWRSSRPI